MNRIRDYTRSPTRPIHMFLGRRADRELEQSDKHYILRSCKPFSFSVCLHISLEKPCKPNAE